MTSVEGLILDFLYLQSFLTVHFCRFWRYLVSQDLKNVYTGCSWKFMTIFHTNGSYHEWLYSHMPPKILILPVPGILCKKLSFMAPNSFILSVIAAGVINFFISLQKCLFRFHFRFNAFLSRLYIFQTNSVDHL